MKKTISPEIISSASINMRSIIGLLLTSSCTLGRSNFNFNRDAQSEISADVVSTDSFSLSDSVISTDPVITTPDVISSRDVFSSDRQNSPDADSAITDTGADISDVQSDRTTNTDSGNTDAGAEISDVQLTDAQSEDAQTTADATDTMNDSGFTSDRPDTGSPPVIINCGRGPSPSYPLSYGIPTGTTVPAEIAIANSMPDGSNVVEINWGDAPTYERIAFDSSTPSRALGNHVYASTGMVTAAWRINGAECGRQSFSVVDRGATLPRCTGFSVSSADIRVSEMTTLRLFGSPRSPAAGDSPLSYNFGNLPTVPNGRSLSGISTITIAAENPPGAGSYALQGWVITPRGERADCPSTILTVRP